MTEEVFALPQGGHWKLMSGRNCPSPGCGYEMSIYIVGVGKDARGYPFCPNCYNNPQPEWGDAFAPGKGITMECPHPDLCPVVSSWSVCDDEETGGVFILDPSSSAPNWRLVSTRL